MSKTVFLDSGSASIQHLCRKDKRFAKLFSMIGPISYTTYEGGYAFLVHEVIEQMISTRAAAKIYARLEALCGGSVTVERISALSDSQIRSRDGTLDPAALSALPDDAVMTKLSSLHGIGDWTAKMYLIFVLDRQDILPFEDVAFLQSYKWLYKTGDTGPKAIRAKCRKWKPYSSIAARYLYRALDCGLTREEFHLFK